MKPKLKFALLLILFALGNITTATESPALNNILQKHLEATGGPDNWDLVESIRLSGSIERQGKTVDLVIVKKRPNQIRATITIPGPNNEMYQMILAHDGHNGWTATRLAGATEMLRKPLDDAAASDLLADSGVLPPLIKLWHNGARIHLAGTENFEGQNAFVMEIEQSERQHTHRFFVSRDSYHLLAHHIQTPTDITETSFYNYTERQGVYLPTRTTITAKSTGTSIMDVKSIEIGVGIYKEYFNAGDPLQTANN
ncbi:hypothetical protein SH580_12190 [Coraliomargarita algicola]|uniref:Outer membrane lipoprotein-sorting protein n=1 Tax=Coraliomargarita algicola TaxID=3092156 RepID=A0ABZ0RGG7_9BACT|nr:hypothetical protein [Coraliomargarita sp. J2-16]WPJ94193.1 hypothetical protein SH580_12190 [Coraliomargarita sp. J2-16]